MRRLVYFSPVPWRGFAQRPHKFVSWFHTQYGAEVLWVEPYAVRLPKLADIQRWIRGTTDVVYPEDTSLPNWLTVTKLRCLPIEPVPFSNAINYFFWKEKLLLIDEFFDNQSSIVVIGKPSKFALSFLRESKMDHVVYDSMDDFPAFHEGISAAVLRQTELKIARLASEIMVSSTNLLRKYSQFENKVSLVCNACDVESLPVIASLKRTKKTTIWGYIGTIGEWFDWGLLILMANSKPDIIFRIIGPVYSKSALPLPENVELLPPCNHGEALIAMQEFSAGLIPFKINKLTESVDPIKYYEYIALGIPVISTSFGEMALRENSKGVYLVDQTTEFSLLDVPNSLLDDLYIEEFRLKNSWSSRFSSV
ncbi:hypothetical protein [uncultured Deefgea sp.]|uniref:hypothetical protein n=1 Tax=uncultured Deefgea sp. TaxID=1304914 RepID=UPI002596D467|nr:hypothetical protein [uncultured Deefgea sp.]